jgi:hypothetical protein
MLCDAKIVALYCFTDDLLKAIGHRGDPQARVSDAEVITTAFVASLFFSGHQDNARRFMTSYGYVPDMLSKSRLNRRLHRLGATLTGVFEVVSHHLKTIAGAADYVLDSFPVPVCDNIRISRCRILRGQAWRGYQASMRRFYYGIKVQVLTLNGTPVEFCITAGSEADVRALHALPLAVAPESSIYADAAYTDYRVEDLLFHTEGVHLAVQRKKNSKRADPPYRDFLKQHLRKGIETTFSQIKARFPRHIHAVTDKGLMLKTALFVISHTFDALTN